jgi:hypothetical protein
VADSGSRDLIIHSRLLRPGNDAGELQVLDEADADLACLTEGVGPHPIFNGVHTTTISGLARPEVREDDGGVTVTAPGLTAELESAHVETTGTSILACLEPAG